MSAPDSIKDLLRSLPDTPGVYQYFDKDGIIIYVGKAKSLKKRVSSYFNKQKHENGKTRVLVSKIVDIKTIVVETEVDALLLENNLIKKYQPRYNVLLKDDKTYPWICIKNERFPRVFMTRKVVKDGSKYFGPYGSVKMVQTLLELMRQLYPLRTCTYQMSISNVNEGKFKKCLEFHIGNCKAPCEGLENERSYNEYISEISTVLKGNINSVLTILQDRMLKFAEELNFEMAQGIKEKIGLLEKYQAKSTVVSASIHNVDVYSISTDDKFGYVNFLKISNGAIIQGHTIELKKKLDESDAALLELAIGELRQRFETNSKEIVIPFEIDLQIEDTKFIVPQRGDKKHLLDLSTRNSKFYMLEKHKQEKVKNPERHTERILTTIQKDLRLSELPVHIECFDNSNIQGTHPVSACVVFKDAKPSKKDYRHFNIKTVVGPDDFASMTEVVYRRYKRLKEEKQDLPQLIIIDGGKGQLSSSLKALKQLDLIGKIAIVGIAKKLEEIYFPGDSFPLYIDKKSESLKLIQHMRNEAHRFGITHHRNRRSKSFIVSELDGIEGIGEKTREQLFQQFKTIKQMKLASKEELAEAIGKTRANLLLAHFKKENLPD